MFRLLLGVAVLASLFAACGGGAGKPKATPVITSGHADPANFNDIVLTGSGRSADAGFHGTYTLRATVDGKVIDGTITWHRKTARMRADFAGKIGDQQEDLIAIVIAGANYPAVQSISICEATKNSCRAEKPDASTGSYPVEAEASALAVQLLDVPGFAKGLNFYDEAARTILKLPALCFVGRSETQPTGPIDHGEICLTDDGLPLLVTGSGTGRTISLTATSVSSGADDSSFQLRYPLAQ